MDPHPHSSLAKFFVYILVALVFFVGGYFVGKGFVMENQGAALYKGLPKGPAGLMNLTPLENGGCHVEWYSDIDGSFIASSTSRYPCSLYRMPTSSSTPKPTTGVTQPVSGTAR